MTGARWSRQNTRASVRRSVLATVSCLSGLSGLTAFLIAVVLTESSPRKVTHAYRLVCVKNVLELPTDVIEEIRMRGKATRGRERMHLLSDLMKGKYVALRRTADDRKKC